VAFFVRSAEKIPCPCCSGTLRVIGSRQRKYIKSSGETSVLRIRRLGCQDCGRIQHELPDILVPFKRYDSASIEAVVTGNAALHVAADEATLCRWRNWFRELAPYFVGCLASIAIRFFSKAADDLPSHPRSVLQRIWQFTERTTGWLARVVRSVTNLNLWVQTRSAFLSG
jgi:hypothetical protein